MVTGIMIAAALVGGTGLIIGLLLGIAGKKLAVQVNEKEIAVREKLPGNNCGGCGYPGCDGLAAAIAAGQAPVNGCPVGGPETAKEIGEIMGEEVGTANILVPIMSMTGLRTVPLCPSFPAAGRRNVAMGALATGLV